MSIPFAVFVDVSDPPGQPLITPLSDDSVKLEWSPPEFYGNSLIEGYAVETSDLGEWNKRPEMMV